jgi:hypothetical protein
VLVDDDPITDRLVRSQVVIFDLSSFEAVGRYRPPSSNITAAAQADLGAVTRGLNADIRGLHHTAATALGAALHRYPKIIE